MKYMLHKEEKPNLYDFIRYNYVYVVRLENYSSQYNTLEMIRYEAD